MAAVIASSSLDPGNAGAFYKPNNRAAVTLNIAICREHFIE
jgi:hypothetical protein